jgi:hypothetical protein
MTDKAAITTPHWNADDGNLRFAPGNWGDVTKRP